MKSKLWLCAALALFAAGCKVLEPKPTSAENPATPGGPSPTAVPQQPQDSGDGTYDPGQTIGEEPPPTPKPTGSNWGPTSTRPSRT